MSSNSTAILLLSGGLDSFVNTALAREQHCTLHAVTCDYGQRAVKQEIAAATRICRHWNIAHQIITVPWLQEITRTALVNRTQQVPRFTATGTALNDVDRAHASAKAVWVPNRNGVFINIAAAIAESTGASWIVTGFNAEEAATFPDNTATFVERTNSYLEYATLSHPRVVSYTQSMTKADIVRCALARDLPLHWCWPCYEAGAQWCGTCESCARFQRAVEHAGGVFSVLAQRAPQRKD